MSDREMWQNNQEGAGEAAGPSRRPGDASQVGDRPHFPGSHEPYPGGPYGPPGGQYPGPGGHYAGTGQFPQFGYYPGGGPYGSQYPHDPTAPYRAAQPYWAGGQYGPPPYGGGQPPYGPGQPAQETGPAPRRGSRGMRSAAAVLAIAAAALAGAGVSRVVWSNGQPASAAAPPVTAPSNNGGSGTNGSPFSLPGSSSNGSSSSSEGAGGPSDVSTIAARVDPDVVDINVSFNYQYAEGAGTGIVLTSNGLVLTNNHVIDEATKISVTDVGNGKTYGATVVGYDNAHDVALLQLQGASGLASAKISSKPASIGEAVVAIGNAGGTGGTPTSAGGSVVALSQSITANDELTQRAEQLSGLIEVNANVESGDSGGPLVNASGQVVGMDTAASEAFTFSTQGNQGFAIPINYAMSVVKQIESGDGTSTVHVGQTAFLGVLLSAPDQPSTGNFNPFGEGGSSFGEEPQTTSNGLAVSSVVSGAPAQQAGIGPGDTITSFAGVKLTSGNQLTKLLVKYHPGQRVSIGWTTATGASHTTTVTLASGPPS